MLILRTNLRGLQLAGGREKLPSVSGLMVAAVRHMQAQEPKGAILSDDVAVSNYLLAEGHVSSVPGSAYGLSPFFRISTATSDE